MLVVVVTVAAADVVMVNGDGSFALKVNVILMAVDFRRRNE